MNQILNREQEESLPNGSWEFLDKAPELMSDEMKKYVKAFFLAYNKRVALAVLGSVEAEINRSRIDGFLVSLSVVKKIIDDEMERWKE